MKLKLFETCLMPALLYGMEAWKKLLKAEIQNLEKIQGKALKRIFSLPITTPNIGVIIETRVWPAEQRINYSSLMLYHNIISSSKNRLVKKIILEQSTKPLKHLQQSEPSYKSKPILTNTLNGCLTDVEPIFNR